jgi:hypothetical protein
VKPCALSWCISLLPVDNGGARCTTPTPEFRACVQTITRAVFQLPAPEIYSPPKSLAGQAVFYRCSDRIFDWIAQRSFWSAQDRISKLRKLTRMYPHGLRHKALMFQPPIPQAAQAERLRLAPPRAAPDILYLCSGAFLCAPWRLPETDRPSPASCHRVLYFWPDNYPEFVPPQHRPQPLDLLQRSKIKFPGLNCAEVLWGINAAPPGSL